MPAVKKLHQESQNNSKPEFIFGHSCQAIAVVVMAAESYFALPLAAVSTGCGGLPDAERGTGSAARAERA